MIPHLTLRILLVVSLFCASLAHAADVEISTYPSGGAFRSNLPATLFNGHVVHHKASINSMIWDCRNSGNNLNQGTSAAAFNATWMYGVRYPGGTVARKWYDYNDQEGFNWLAEQGVTDTTHPFDTVDDILTWCRDESMRAYFIVPVVRFWPDDYDGAVNNAVDAVAQTYASSIALNAPMPEYWDVGNEVYEDVPDGSPSYDSTNYAYFAGRIAQAIKNEVSFVKPVVCVKRSTSKDRMKEIKTTLQNNGFMSSIAGVSMHVLDVGLKSWRGDIIKEQAQTMIATFPNKTPMVTALAPAEDNGLVSANAMLGSYRQLLRAGIEHIVVWPITHFNIKGRQYHNGALTPSGQFLQWFSMDSVGSDLMNTVHNGSNNINVITIRKSANEVVVYVAGNAAGTVTNPKKSIELTVGGFSNATVSGQRLTATNGDINSDVVTVQSVNPAGSNPFYFSINKHSQYEIVRLTFTK